ncbi:MAG: purine-binding chemotaxis protein CheW [Oceanospirillaceae bacterium]|nr:purine-binding chemotaxis protein CheW [Oceanospirillaceae bacterium]MCP5350081.1 purine-binding chemotaxis protein CheW [Oceanospirillaceae bacterium]
MVADEIVREESDTGVKEEILTEQYLTFIMADEEYGVDILAVQEIRGWDTATPIPNAPDHIMGVINLRGTIVPIIDLRRRFKLAPLAYGLTTVVVVLKIDTARGMRNMGVIVDAVSDVYDVPLQGIRKTGMGDNANARFIKGLVTINDSMVILLELEKLLTIED